MAHRVETDSLGEVSVPHHHYFGAQTQRSLHNFPIGKEKMPLQLIYAYAFIKKACAIVNGEQGLLEKDKQEAISKACEEILEGKWDEEFPLSVWQTGSGTQTNMNVNEVVANLASEKLGGARGNKHPVHPNDDVNKSQSSNDSFPTAMHIAALQLSYTKLLPALQRFLNVLDEKAKKWEGLIKIGRTHLMDATPLTLGQEFSAYAQQIRNGIEAFEQTLPHMQCIALGGTAVGTGINTPPGFAKRVAEVLSSLLPFPVETAPNKFEALAAHDALVEMSGALKRIACSLMKIANDLRFLASGPRCGLGELTLPSNEPGSSIMPGKVNPTQCEALTMIVAQVFGNDATIAFAGSQGNFELNVYKPVMIYNLLQSLELLADGVESFNLRCVSGVEVREEQVNKHLHNSLMLVTALNRAIGYDKASQIAKKAYQEGSSLKEATLSMGLLSEEQFDEIVDPKKMV